MKKKAYLLVSMLTSFLIMGCGSQVPDLTENEMEQISSYATQVLLQFDTRKTSRLVDLSLYEDKNEETSLEENVNDENIEESGGMDPTVDTPTESLVENEEGTQTSNNSSITLTEFMDISEALKIEYEGHEICDTYPDNRDTNNSFSIDAAEGNKLLVLNFRLINQGNENIHVDLLEKNYVFRIKMNGSNLKNCLVTFLENDLSTFLKEVKPGEEIESILVAEYSETFLEEISKITLSLTDGITRNEIVLE